MSDSEFYTVDEMAKYLGVHTSTIYRMLKKRELPTIKVGRDWRFKKDSIAEWVKQQELDNKTKGEV